MSPKTEKAILSAGRTHMGLIRHANEDAFIDRPDLGLWAVADGVGGNSGGDYASRLIADALNKVEAPTSASGFLRNVTRKLEHVNQDLHLLANQCGLTAPIASTVAVLMFFAEHFAYAWAGDSRLYLLRDGQLQQLTRDHSRIQTLIDSGAVRAEIAGTLTPDHAIVRAVGAEDELVLDTGSDRLKPNDLFLLCTDGLTNMVDEARIISILRSKIPSAAVEALIQAALANGGKDNVTAIVICYAPAPRVSYSAQA